MLSALFVNTSCDKIFGNLDTSVVDSYLKLDKTTVTLTPGATDKIAPSTISDGTITYSSSDEKIATVDANGNITAGVKSGEATITARLAESGSYAAGNASCTVKVFIETGEQFKADLDAKQNDDAITIYLAEGAAINMTSTIKPTKDCVIKGSESKPATMTVTRNFEVSKSLALENINIDASGNTDKSLIKMVKPAVADLLPNQTTFYGINNMTFKNTEITGIKGNLFYDNGVEYCVLDFTIDNSIIKFATVPNPDKPADPLANGAALIHFGKGGIKDLTVKNSTITGSPVNSIRFIRYASGDAQLEKFGFTGENDTWSMTYTNNTFYNVVDNQWANYNSVATKAAKMIVTIKDNIWVDCTKDVIRRLFQGKKFTDFKDGSEMSNNTIYAAGAIQSQSSYSNGTELTTDPAFKDVTKEDFTPTGADQVAKKTGDPRWFK